MIGHNDRDDSFKIKKKKQIIDKDIHIIENISIKKHIYQ